MKLGVGVSLPGNGWWIRSPGERMFPVARRELNSHEELGDVLGAAGDVRKQEGIGMPPYIEGFDSPR